MRIARDERQCSHRHFCFSFTGLVQRGGGTGPHKDGWGITFYEDKGCRTFKDPLPSFNSPIARLVQEYPIKSHSVVAHIRQANRGPVSLENTHPFTRELWGRNWTYAHNGQLKGYRQLETGTFRPVGETDSEKAFCWILHKLATRYPRTPGNWPAVFRYIGELAGELRQKGVFNMLLSDGRYLMAFCSTICSGLPAEPLLAGRSYLIRMWKLISRNIPARTMWSLSLRHSR